MATVNVLLADEDANKLKQHVYSIITDEVKRARQDTALDRPIATQKEISEYLGISPTTCREYMKLGMPYSSIGKRVFYDKNECKNWIMKQQI